MLQHKKAVSSFVIALFLLSILLLMSACNLLGNDNSDYSSSEYSNAINQMNQGNYQTALDIFSSIADHKDSAEKIKECKYALGQEAIVRKDWATAISYFENLDYKDSEAQLCLATQEAIAEKISDMDIQALSKSDIEDIFTNCKNLTQEQFYQIENVSAFEDMFLSCVNSLGQSCKWDEALLLIQKADLLDSSCIEESLISYGRWKSIEIAEDYIKEQLKSPRSYYRYKASISTPVLKGDYYQVTAYLTYGATNSFGGEVKSEDDIIVRFYLDVENENVTFECVGNLLDLIGDVLG